MAPTVTLYHFTCEDHLSSILNDGCLRTTESNLSRTRPHAGPDVAWFGTMPEMRPGGSFGLHDGTVSSGIVDPDNGRPYYWADKTAIRITVELPKREVQAWEPFVKKHGIDAKYLEALRSITPNWRRQRVITRPVDNTEWIEVRHMHTGETFDWRDPEVLKAVTASDRFHPGAGDIMNGAECIASVA
ncbi:MAG: hypothetical protein V7697_18590 [Rhodococcus erythropolis]